MNKKFSLLCSFVLIVSLNQLTARTETDLSHYPWIIWLDYSAQWQNDKLFITNESSATSQIKEPTIGWEKLEKTGGQKTTLPATVEQYFWGQNGNPFGVSGDYKGVSWFSTTFFVPKEMKGKRVSLHFESVRMRAEVFVNQNLVGSDLINGTPFEVDITDAARYGAENKLSVRITDPNGNFDWRDYEQFTWGQYKTIPSHGFGGITGKVLTCCHEQGLY